MPMMCGQNFKFKRLQISTESTDFKYLIKMKITR